MRRSISFVDRLNENTNLLLIVYTLTLSLIERIVIFVSLNTRYLYDEVIVTEISKQPLRKLLDTVSSEPHPPGFYLFLKLFPVDNVLATRISLCALFFVSITAILIYGYKSGVIKRYNMEVGMALFFCMSTFYYSSFFVKQDIVSLLFFLLTLFLLLNYHENGKQKLLIGATFLIFSQFFFGYVHFVYSFGMLLVAVFSTEKVNKQFFRKNWYLLFFSIPILFYLLLYFPTQFQNNLHRFGWLKDGASGMVAWLGGNLFSRQDIFLGITDFMVLVFLVILFNAISKRISGAKPFYKDTLLMFFFMTVVVSYLFGWFKMARYSISSLFLAWIVVGNSLRKYLDKKYGHYILIIVVIWFQVMSASFLWYVADYDEKLYATISDALNELSRHGKTKIGFLTSHEISAFVLKINAPKDIATALTPISPVVDFNWDPEEINKKLLLKDGVPIKMSVEEVASFMKSKGMDSYLYLFFESNSYYDPDLKLITALSTLCDIEKVYSGTGAQLIYFNNCQKGNENGK
jgi:hypothetical protein